MISDNPNVSPGIVDCSNSSRSSALTDDYYKKPMVMVAYPSVEFNYLKTLTKTFIIPAWQNQFIHKNFFNDAPVRQIAIAMNTKLCIRTMKIHSGFRVSISNKSKYSDVISKL